LLATCEAELLELWLLPELADEWEPPELLPCEPPELAELFDPLAWLPEELLEELLDTLVELELPELDPLAPDVCCEKRAAGTNRIAAITRPENCIKHLPTDSSLTLLRC
jgi:hypothetical protein